jgi:hypothetical protein
MIEEHKRAVLTVDLPDQLRPVSQHDVLHVRERSA